MTIVFNLLIILALVGLVLVLRKASNEVNQVLRENLASAKSDEFFGDEYAVLGRQIAALRDPLCQSDPPPSVFRRLRGQGPWAFGGNAHQRRVFRRWLSGGAR